MVFMPPVLRLVQPPAPHSGIGLITPDAVHPGRAEAIHADRSRVLAAAYAATPRALRQTPPRPPALPTAAWINEPDDEQVTAHQFLDHTVSSGLRGSGNGA